MDSFYSSEPKHQYRYLEPYKNRVFHSDTPDSNLYFADYANNILNIVGKDVILEGLDIRVQYTPAVEAQEATSTSEAVAASDDKLVINIFPGSVVHNHTMVEMPLITTFTMTKLSSIITDPENQGILIYTSYSYIRTLDDNPFLIEAVPFDYGQHKLVDSDSLWNEQKNRIILGLIKFTKDSSSGAITDAYYDAGLSNLWIISNQSNPNLISTDAWLLNNLIKKTESTEPPNPYIGYAQTSGSTNKQYVYKTISTTFGNDYAFHFSLGGNYSGCSGKLINCYAINGEIDLTATNPLTMYNVASTTKLSSAAYSSTNIVFTEGELGFTAQSETTTILFDLSTSKDGEPVPVTGENNFIAILSYPVLYKSYIYRKHTDITSNYTSIDGGEL